MNQLQQLLQQLRNLDPNDPGRWPLGVRIAFVVLLFLFAASAGYYYFVWKAQRPCCSKSAPRKSSCSSR